MFDLSAISAGLPLSSEAVSAALTSRQLVVEAPPGTGKTTLVPPALANLVAAHDGGKVLVTSPRRVTTRAAARRLAHLSGTPGLVGYRVKGDSVPGRAVEFLTPRILVNHLLRDPLLEGIGGVIIDEVHERHLDTDLLLGMLIQVAELREDLHVVAMSATADATRFASLMGAEVASFPAPTYPLTTQYAPHPGRLEMSRDYLIHLADLARRGTRDADGGRTLVFVPRIRDVDTLVQMIPGALPLHGSLSAAEQDRALNPPAPGDGQVIVSTPIAESSLTVPGVRRVIDTGLERVPTRDSLRGVTGLITRTISQSSATQRAGRAAREAPGTVICAYSASDISQPFPTPEIAAADLTDAALVLAAWADSGFGEAIPLLDEPPTPAWASAWETLQGLGLVSIAGELTDVGRQAARLPVEPRSATALLTLGSGAADTIARLTDDSPGRLARMTFRSQPVAPGVVAQAMRPEWVARRVREGEYLTAAGFRVSGAPLPHTDWIVATDITRSGDRFILHGWEEVDTPPTPTVSREIVSGKGGELARTKPQVREVARVGAIVLSETPVQPTAEEQAQWEAQQPARWSEKATSLWERLNFAYRHAAGDRWPEPIRPTGAHTDAYQALMAQIPYDKFDQLPPETFTTPAGHAHRIDYSGETPHVAAKLQEFFGLTATPRILGVPVTVELLSPAGRPLAVTGDLASFWAGPYREVRRQMRGRYPKHPWPEDPLTAMPTNRTKRAQP
ncbi:MAG: ATP-dependent helicase C-terminal domain-containing protein [Corynebacterium sp.]|nr:ATP-dependent helicase C-terminal domain-containing protein [Corynebacterium sp.]